MLRIMDRRGRPQVHIGGLAFVLVALSAALLAGCSFGASAVEREIDGIGEVTADSAEKLESIESDYQALSEEEKHSVRNFDVLQAALDEYNRKATDKAFLVALEESILDRMEHKDDPDIMKLINTEYVYLDQFRDKECFDDGIAKAKKQYLEGLDVQKAALGESFKSDIQIGMQRGRVLRYDALASLNRDYGFLSDNEAFIGSYVSGLEGEKRKLEAYEAIESDIDSQNAGEEADWGVNSVSFVVRNDTDYEFSTVWECSLKNESGVVTETTNCSIENIKPHSVYTVTFYYSNPSSGYGGFDWSNYYTNVVV